MVLPGTVISHIVALAFSSASIMLGFTPYGFQRRQSSAATEQQTAAGRRLDAVRGFVVLLLPPSMGLLAHSALYMVGYFKIHQGVGRDDVEAVNLWVSFIVAVFTKQMM